MPRPTPPSHARLASRFTARIALIACLTLSLGCATYGPTNPSFDLEVDQAWAALDEMATQPHTPPRPIVVLAGWNDPGTAVGTLADMLDEAIGDASLIVVHFALTGNFDACRERVINAVDMAYPNDDPVWTSEVDVVAISMGGLVARYAAADPPTGNPVRRLRINRLFTIGTPHRGADLATLPTPDHRQFDMRGESEFLQQLDASFEDADYELYPYVRLGDLIVGAPNTAPPGDTPWWLPNRRLELAHAWAYRDPRIVADITRRLRDEEPFATNPRTPLPGREDEDKDDTTTDYAAADTHETQ
ncbi:esterase/lipase family protein [Phycisphaerales bacterium AB-hyl4]|uniref:Esterase/lipase family protein n=1 Tax=Natronomicrosphaera hydrolytica TaxID=3242702 RepID=A0ABV4U6N4_9BACT